MMKKFPETNPVFVLHQQPKTKIQFFFENVIISNNQTLPDLTNKLTRFTLLRKKISLELEITDIFPQGQCSFHKSVVRLFPYGRP